MRLRFSLLVLFLPTIVAAEEAEQISIHIGRTHSIRVGAVIEHIVVNDVEVVQVLRTAPNVVQLIGQSEGSSMVIVWTASGRWIYVAKVVRPPRPIFGSGMPTAQLRAGGSNSLYGYRGTLLARERPDGGLTGQRHHVFGYYPTESGRFEGRASVDIYEPSSVAQLSEFRLGFRDEQLVAEAGDVTAEPLPLPSGPTLVRGANLALQVSGSRIGAYGGLEAGGRNPQVLFDPERAVRYGGFLEYEAWPATDLGLHALRRDGVGGRNGDFSVTQVMPSLRWAPSPEAWLVAAGGFNQRASSASARFRGSPSRLQISSGYWHRGSSFDTPTSPRSDQSDFSLLYRPSRSIDLVGTASWLAEGASAFASPPHAERSLRTQTLGLGFFAVPILDQVRMTGSWSSEDSAPGVSGRVGDDRQLRLLLARRVSSRLGTLRFEATHRERERPSTVDAITVQSRSVQLAWNWGLRVARAYTIVGYADSEANSSSLGSRDRYIYQGFDLRRGNLLLTPRLQFTHRMSPRRTILNESLLAGHLKAEWRPTQAHEFRGEVFVSSSSHEVDPTGITPISSDAPTQVQLVFSYAHYFGGSVEAPSLFRRLWPRSLVVHVFLDTNENGRFDPGEAGVPDVAISVDRGSPRLSDENGEVLAQMAESGYSTIEADVLGSTQTRFLRFTTASSVVVSGADPQTRDIYMGVSDRARITGALFNDANLDGIRQRDEPGLDRVPIELHGESGSVDRTTSSNGRFSFQRLMPGAYRVEIPRGGLPPNYEPTETELGVEAAPSQLVQANFAVLALRSIGGFVYLDENRDGVRQSDEVGVGEVKIRWRDGAARSNTAGRFLLRRLPAGVLELRVEDGSLPPDYEPGDPVSVRLSVSPSSVEVDLPVWWVGGSVPR